MILYDGSEEEGDNNYSALARRTTLEEIAPKNFMPEEATPLTRKRKRPFPSKFLAQNFWRAWQDSID